MSYEHESLTFTRELLTMEAPADGQHSIIKDDRGVKALDILRYQFSKVNDANLSEYLRTYKRSGLSLPTAKFAGTGNRAIGSTTSPS